MADDAPELTPLSRPLLVCRDPLVAADVRRLAAAAGADPRVVESATEALTGWSTAPLVLVDAGLVGELAERRPPRRPGVHAVGRAPLPDGTFRNGLTLGVETVVELPDCADWLVELLTDAGDESGQGVLVGVLGGCGGAGASVFAGALGRTAAAEVATVLIDLDPDGGGVERVLGLEQVAGVRWDSLAQVTGRLGGRSLREALPVDHGLHVLAQPRGGRVDPPALAVREVLAAATRGFGCAVVDLPRHPGPVAAEAMARCDRLVLVSTLTVAGVAAAVRTAARLPAGVPAGVVTRGGAGCVRPEDAAASIGLPLLHAMAPQRRLDELLDLGGGPPLGRRSRLGRAARACLPALLAARGRL